MKFVLKIDSGDRSLSVGGLVSYLIKCCNNLHNLAGEQRGIVETYDGEKIGEWTITNDSNERVHT